MTGYALRKTITLRLVDRLVERNIASSLLDELPDGLHVALCGAGSSRMRLLQGKIAAVLLTHGRDGTLVRLPADSEAIELDELL